MQEDFLHYIWKYKAFDTNQLKTVEGERIFIHQLGQHNNQSGPDFFNAQLVINQQLWAGNVEIHVKSSDWYVHNHEVDKAYDNVILHVVWEHDTDIFRKNNSQIPTLELKAIVSPVLFQNYMLLIKSKTWINCEVSFSDVDDFILNNWLERLFIERLERKSKEIEAMLKVSQNDWEAVFFKMLLKNFGLKVNGDSFLSLAKAQDFSIVRKIQHDVFDMEALLFGQGQLLSENIQNGYFNDLKQRYDFLCHKFKLDNQGVLPLQFFRLRPPNFPTIRLSQFANLYALENHMFSKVIALKTKAECYALFKKGTTDFWKSHYTFTKTSKLSHKVLTTSFIDLLIINTIAPIKFAYAKAHGNLIEEELFRLIRDIKIENNSIVLKFLELRTIEKNALNSQGLLQLKQEYCDRNKCLQCQIGNRLILKN